MTQIPSTFDTAITTGAISSPPHLPTLPSYTVNGYSGSSVNVVDWLQPDECPPIMLETKKSEISETLARIERGQSEYVPEDSETKVPQGCIRWCKQNIENIAGLLLLGEAQFSGSNFYVTQGGEIKIQWCEESEALTCLINWEDGMLEWFHSNMKHNTSTSGTISLHDSDIWSLLRIKVLSSPSHD